MSETNPGMCAAYGCPLFGSVKGGVDAWFCCCHMRGAGPRNDAITLTLNTEPNATICQAVCDIRRFGNHDDWPSAKQRIAKSFAQAGRRDLLPNDADAGLRGWLARLERTLILATNEVGRQQLLREVPAVKSPIIGPTHVSGHMPYPENS